MERTEISHMPLPLDSPSISIHQSGAIVTADGPTLPCHHPPTSTVHGGAHAWFCTFYGIWTMYNVMYQSL